MSDDLKRIDDLLTLQDECEAGDELPSEAHIKFAKNFIETAMLHLKEKYPRALIGTDYSGGIGIEYQNGDKHLRLRIKKDLAKTYIYWQDGADYNAHDIGGDRALFISKLSWLVQ